MVKQCWIQDVGYTVLDSAGYPAMQNVDICARTSRSCHIGDTVKESAKQNKSIFRLSRFIFVAFLPFSLFFSDIG